MFQIDGRTFVLHIGFAPKNVDVKCSVLALDFL